MQESRWYSILFLLQKESKRVYMEISYAKEKAAILRKHWQRLIDYKERYGNQAKNRADYRSHDSVVCAYSGKIGYYTKKSKGQACSAVNFRGNVRKKIGQRLGEPKKSSRKQPLHPLCHSSAKFLTEDFTPLASFALL